MDEGLPAEFQIDDPAYQKAVFVQAYEQTCLQLQESAAAMDIRALSQVLKRRDEAIDEVSAAFATKNRAACEAGCSFCCHQMVVCAPVEIFVIARHLLDTRSPAEMASLKAKLAQRAGLPLETQARHGASKPCVLLDANRCSIYEHRPSLCRTMLSTSREACETSLASGEQKVPFIGAPVVIAFLRQLGIDHALITQKHVSTEKLEMSRALSVALEHFDRAFADWSQGKDAFADYHVDMGGGRSNHDLAERAAAQCGFA